MCREDEAKDYADKLEMMREVPERDGNYVRVPKIGQ